MDELNINSIPLFSSNGSENELLFRRRLDSRNDSNFEVLTLPQSRSQWYGMLVKVDKAEPFINMYPFSQSFNSTSVTVHFRQLSSSSIVANFYGPLDPGPLWNMKAQIVIAASIPHSTTWVSADKIGTTEAGAEVFSLIGSSIGLDDRISTYQLGISISDQDYSLAPLWSARGIFNNICWTLVEVVQADFDFGKADVGIVEYWKCDMNETYKLEVYSLPAKFDGSPDLVLSDWRIANIR